ncbi:MAG: hypothetical protein ACFCU5_15570 [Pleurocapsa sp.]
MTNNKYYFWLSLSIIVAILFSFSGLKPAFASIYTVQDDARQHVFWMYQFSDRDLFSNDLIAKYFSSVAPFGYKSLYLLANFLGIEPFLFNKILPLIIGIVTSIYIFLVCLELLPVPFAGFVAALLLNQNLWMLDDIVSGTPRAFFYLLFLAFVYYLLRLSLLPCLLAIILQGLFYPQVVLISTTILVIRLIYNWLISRSLKFFYLIGLVLAILILGIYALQTSEFSQVISLETAKSLAEFYPGGRNSFFIDNSIAFWLVGQRSGFFPREWQYVLLSSFGLCLPILKLYPRRFPLVTKIDCKIEIIWQILLASLLMFALAHLFLFKLHLPSRYSQHSLRILIALINGIAIAIMINGITKNIGKYKKLLKPLITVTIITLLLYPTYAVQAYDYRLGYETGTATKLYQFLQQQPKDILIASLSQEADFIPSLAKRSVLTAQEYSIPYHLDYYLPIRQRTQDLIGAQYSDSLTEIKTFISKYNIDLWLIDKNAFTVNYLQNNNWLQQFKSETNQAIALLQENKSPAILSKINDCSIFTETNLILLNAKCIKEQ